MSPVACALALRATIANINHPATMSTDRRRLVATSIAFRRDIAVRQLRLADLIELAGNDEIHNHSTRREVSPRNACQIAWRELERSINLFCIGDRIARVGLALGKRI